MLHLRNNRSVRHLQKRMEPRQKVTQSALACLDRPVAILSKMQLIGPRPSIVIIDAANRPDW